MNFSGIATNSTGTYTGHSVGTDSRNPIWIRRRRVAVGITRISSWRNLTGGITIRIITVWVGRITHVWIGIGIRI
jgi:hypothetical protein